MSRSFAGAFDAESRLDVSRLDRLFAPDARSLLDHGELRATCRPPGADAGGILCLLDGHLDNADDLRLELEARTPPHDSIELLLADCWRRWGSELLPRLRGDFVLLLWDTERREGLLARDQLGARPCFVCERASGVYFASEIRDLLALLPTRPAPDATSVAHWISVSARTDLSTFYEGIERLAPGTALLFDRRGARRWRYWSARFCEPLDLGRDELVARVQAELERAVRRRLAPGAGASTGVLMSGGLDSSTVAAIAAAQTGAGVRACSAEFPEHAAADEAELIAELARALALPSLRATVVPGGLLASAVESIATWQTPLLGWGDFWALPLMRAAARDGVTVMLDGDGGDELFGVRDYLLADRLRQSHPLDVVSLARRLPGAGARPPRRQLAAMIGSRAFAGALPYGPHRLLQRAIDARRAPPWLRPAARRELLRSGDPMAWKRLDGPRWWGHAAYAMTQAIEQTGMFEHQRRRAALAGLEARHPLLDLDLVELCLQAPPRDSFDPWLNRPLLRSATRGLLPDSVRLRAGKARFESLIVDCLRGPDARAMRRLLLGPGAQIGAYVDVAAMRTGLLDSSALLEASPLSWMWQLWRLVNVECWLRAQDGSLDQLAPLMSPARVVIATPAVACS
jgi:asparagine synthase (glutamine-hydrolysing)